MGVEQLSEEEFDAFVRKEQKMHKRKQIITGIGAAFAVLGMYVGIGYAICKHAENIRDCAIEESVQRAPIEEVKAIVNEVSSPLEAFVRISKDIEFIPGFDKNRFGIDYWASLQETYGMMRGECEDGAIAFKAMLADNPEYTVRLVSLQSKSKELESHMIAAYKDANTQLWGIVSFNNLQNDELVNLLLIPIHSALNAAVEAYAKGKFKSWHTVEISSDNLISGSNLANDVESSSERRRL